ncbi:Beta-barrel assembly-enhancing protease [Paraburkholderia phenoliruptrix]|uniref:Beta-barrel assembly-enhancing protease n=1 Tax=Paraburkholderia phenoliruptrix TaxID=252970 RepID=A0A6J4ZQK8_9BURK|nr:tetratricopeptide repeat protein [Paraburkholderia phenoliruptrix]CAB3638056.1 Beta-barrel assembly-enhancing protease [Paraburkholderia phenoliruptrix]
MKQHVISSCRSLAVASVVAVFVLAGCESTGAIDSRPLSGQQKLSPASDLHIADSALSAGNTELALTLYDKALQARPDSIEAQLGLADTVYQAGDLERARVLYARTAAAAPSNPRPKLGLARVALRQRRLDAAAALYRTLAAQLPDNPVTAEGLGTVLDLQGRHDEAQAVYRAALRAHPEVQGLTTDLGLSLILANKPREAANVLLEIAGLANAPPQARQNLALAYALLGNRSAAKQILQADLPPASVEDNLRFYETLRTKLEPPAEAAAAARLGAVSTGRVAHDAETAK